MANAEERIMTDDTGKEILEALRNIPGVVGATAISHGGTGATTAEDALRNLGGQPLIGVDVEEELNKRVKTVNSIAPDDSGNITLTHVRTAENLTSDDAQDIYGSFIERTTGGMASLTDGKSWIGIMEGNSVRVGHIPEGKSVQVTNMSRNPITASVDWDDFRTAVNNVATNIIFSHEGVDWNDDPENYGITVEGYPIVGDTITVSFTPKSESYSVTSDAGIVVTMNWPTYEAIYNVSPITFFNYASGAWNVDITAYGITVTGAPRDGDIINIQYTPEAHSMYVNPAARGEALVAYVNWDIAKGVIGDEATTVTFAYSTEWSRSLETYGITISGSPIRGDRIVLYYTPEVRGQIVNATPTKFVSTGWNLYNHTLGYARVLKYSENYGFKISGTYTTAMFVEELTDDPEPLTIDSNGNFNIPSDGYVVVTGGNDTYTAIYMTWSDWTSGYSGILEPYHESVIDLASLMQTAFPYGLCSVGSVSDSIDFSNKIANSKIERTEYSAENLIAVRNSGAEYNYDEDYIYFVKAQPSAIGFSLSYELDAYDHGMERVEGTEVPVFVHMLYGHNLRDKLRTDVVTISKQVLTDNQKRQIRENIGLGGVAQLPIANGGTGAIDDSGARTNLGLGTAAVKNVASAISTSDIGLPTSAMVSQAISSAVSTLNSNLSSLVGYSRSSIAGGSSYTFTLQISSLVAVLWNNTTLTVSIVNNNSHSCVFGTIPSSCDISVDGFSVTINNGQSFACGAFIFTKGN